MSVASSAGMAYSTLALTCDDTKERPTRGMAGIVVGMSVGMVAYIVIMSEEG